MKNYIYLFICLLILGCSSKETKITEDEVKNKFYDFFKTLSVDNPDKTKLYDLVTDEYYIF